MEGRLVTFSTEFLRLAGTEWHRLFSSYRALMRYRVWFLGKNCALSNSIPFQSNRLDNPKTDFTLKVLTTSKI